MRSSAQPGIAARAGLAVRVTVVTLSYLGSQCIDRVAEANETGNSKIPGSEESYQEIIAALSTVMKFIFSWFVLAPIAVIVSGMLLSNRLLLRSGPGHYFAVRIFGVLDIRARGTEAVLGFVGFLITLLLVGGINGAWVYRVFRINFGIDPGQFNSLCIVSALLLVTWTFLVYLLSKPFRLPSDIRLQAEHDRKISELAQRHEAQTESRPPRTEKRD